MTHGSHSHPSALPASDALVLRSLPGREYQDSCAGPDHQCRLLNGRSRWTVTVEQGTYFENVIIPFSDQTLRAHGKVTIDGDEGRPKQGVVLARALTGSYIGADQTTVDGCRVRFTSYSGVHLQTTDAATITNTRIVDTGTHGVYLYRSNNCVIDACTIKRPGLKGVYVLGSVNTILDNRICYPGSHGIKLGSELAAASGNFVEGNDISHAFLDAIKRIEKKLATCHLEDDGLPLYDLTSSHFEGTTCPLAARGHNRDGKQENFSSKPTAAAPSCFSRAKQAWRLRASSLSCTWAGSNNPASQAVGKGRRGAARG